jgi:hypothetical protein
MTIKDLPILDTIQTHFLNVEPLPNEFSLHVQGTKYFIEARYKRVMDYKLEENKLAHLLKFNTGSAYWPKQSAIDEYGQEAVSNAQRHLNQLLKRSNISPIGLQYAAIAWYIEQIVDIEKTKEHNKWD